MASKAHPRNTLIRAGKAEGKGKGKEKEEIGPTSPAKSYRRATVYDAVAGNVQRTFMIILLLTSYDFKGASMQQASFLNN